MAGEAQKAAAQPHAPRPGLNGYTCSAKLSWSDPPTDAEIRRLEARCDAVAPAQAREVNECPCTELGTALGYRKDAASRKRGMVVLMAACEAGSYDACDGYELGRALCLQGPEQPECEALRARGLIPTEPLPLARVLGCRAFEGSILCVQRDRYYVRGLERKWDQRRVLGWRRNDAQHEARWEGRLDGGVLVLTPTRIVEHSFAPRLEPEGGAGTAVLPGPLAEATGASRKLTAAEQAEARHAMKTLPRVEDACAATDACIIAIAELSRPPPAPGDDESEGEGAEEIEPPHHSPSLRACQAARAAAIARFDGRPPPAACAAAR